MSWPGSRMCKDRGPWCVSAHMCPGPYPAAGQAQSTGPWEEMPCPSPGLTQCPPISCYPCPRHHHSPPNNQTGLNVCNHFPPPCLLLSSSVSPQKPEGFKKHTNLITTHSCFVCANGASFYLGNRNYTYFRTKKVLFFKIQLD